MHKWMVYSLIDSNGAVFYIGATYKPKRRLKEHRTKFGSNISMTIVETGFASAQECGEAERRIIAAMRSQGITLVNISNGGFVGGVHRESTRKKISEAFKGRIVTWGHKIAAATRGKPHDWSEEGRLSAARTQFKAGQERSAEAKRSTNQKSYLKSLTYEQRSAMSVKANKGWWARATPEERAERSRKMLSARDNSKISERMKISARKRTADPQVRKAFGQRVKNFWANMTPDQKDEYVKRRAVAIAQAKAAKRI